MGSLHRRLEQHGQQALLLEAPNKTARKLIEIATGVLADDGDDRVFTHPVLCLTILPHRARPQREIWKRVNGPYTLMVQPTADHDGAYHGVPHGSKARLILLYLQTEAVKTNSRVIELGTSMRRWLRSMGVTITGPNYQEVRRQAQKIERALVSFSFVGEGATVSWQDTIIRGSFERPCSDEVRTVELSESFFKSITERPVPVCEAAIRLLGERCMALDLYLWLAYRLHSLQRPTVVSWTSLHSQFGAATRLLKHFKPHFAREIDAALAAYPDARVDLTEDGIRLQPSPPPTGSILRLQR
jgi:Plasmid encoded RepA protein